MAAAIFTAVQLPCLNAQHATLTFPLVSRWASMLVSTPSFPPAYDSGYVFVPLRNGQLATLSLVDGRQAWTTDVKVSAGPAAGEGLVFAGVDGFIEARAQVDGRLRWRTPIEGRLAAPLHWDTGWLLASSARGELLAIRGADGEVLWRRDLPAAMHGLPAPAGDRLYVSLEDGRLMAMSLQTGAPIWTKNLTQAAAGILALDDRLFLGSLDNFFYCLSAKDGVTRWTWRTGADILGSPVIDDSRVYVVSLDNELRALDRHSGALRWQRQLPFRPSTGPLLSGETIIVAGGAAQLRAFAARTGSPAGEFVLKSEQGDALQLAAPPSLGTEPAAPLIIITRDGRIEGLGPAPPPAVKTTAPAIAAPTAPAVGTTASEPAKPQ